MGRTKTKKYNIEKRVAEETGLTACQTHEILSVFFDVLKDECNTLEEGEYLSYNWLSLRCKKTKERMLKEHMIGWKGEDRIIPSKLVISPRIHAGFYADKSKGIESNWGA